MSAHEESFQAYLRDEVSAAGKRYEQAFEKVLLLTGNTGTPPAPDLLDASETLSESFRIYTGALRRLANFVPKRQSHDRAAHA